jgi:hypothetical protein
LKPQSKANCRLQTKAGRNGLNNKHTSNPVFVKKNTRRKIFISKDIQPELPESSDSNETTFTSIKAMMAVGRGEGSGVGSGVGS